MIHIKVLFIICWILLYYFTLKCFFLYKPVGSKNRPSSNFIGIGCHLDTCFSHQSFYGMTTKIKGKQRIKAFFYFSTLSDINIEQQLGIFTWPHKFRSLGNRYINLFANRPVEFSWFGLCLTLLHDVQDFANAECPLFHSVTDDLKEKDYLLLKTQKYTSTSTRSRSMVYLCTSL